MWTKLLHAVAINPPNLLQQTLHCHISRSGWKLKQHSSVPKQRQDQQDCTKHYTCYYLHAQHLTKRSMSNYNQQDIVRHSAFVLSSIIISQKLLPHGQNTVMQDTDIFKPLQSLYMRAEQHHYQP